MKQKGFAGIIVLVAVLILAGLGGAYYFGKTQNPKSNSQSQITSLTPTPAVSDETVYTEASRSADWTTYTNNDGGFSLRYPSNWSYTLCNEGDKFPNAILNFTTNNKKVSCGMEGGPFFQIRFTSKQTMDEEIGLITERYSFKSSVIDLNENKAKAKRYDLTQDLQSGTRPYFTVPSTVIYIPSQLKAKSAQYNYMVITYPSDKEYGYATEIEKILMSLSLF